MFKLGSQCLMFGLFSCKGLGIAELAFFMNIMSILLHDNHKGAWKLIMETLRGSPLVEENTGMWF